MQDETRRQELANRFNRLVGERYPDLEFREAARDIFLYPLSGGFHQRILCPLSL